MAWTETIASWDAESRQIATSAGFGLSGHRPCDSGTSENVREMVLLVVAIVCVFLLVAVTLAVAMELKRNAKRLKNECFHIDGSGYYRPDSIIATSANGANHVVRAHEYHETWCSLHFKKGREVALKFVSDETVFQSELACRGMSADLEHETIVDEYNEAKVLVAKAETDAGENNILDSEDQERFVKVSECFRLAATIPSKAYGDIGSVAIGEGEGGASNTAERSVTDNEPRRGCCGSQSKPEPEPKSKPEPAALTEKEIRDKDKYMKNHRIISETSKGRFYWDVFQVVLILYVVIVVPYRIVASIDPQPWEFAFVVDVFVDVFFIVDIGLNFSTAVVDGNKVKYKRADIASESSDTAP
eukprot:COSAG06_NODE_3723_length_4973_cov_1.907879_2_plen_359_part_00